MNNKDLWVIINRLEEDINNKLFSFHYNPIKTVTIDGHEESFSPFCSVLKCEYCVADIYDLSSISTEKKGAEIIKAHIYAKNEAHTPLYLFFYDKGGWKGLHMLCEAEEYVVSGIIFHLDNLEEYVDNSMFHLWDTSLEDIGQRIQNDDTSIIKNKIVKDMLQKTKLRFAANKGCMFEERVINVFESWMFLSFNNLVRVKDSLFSISQKEEDKLFLAILGTCKQEKYYRYGSSTTLERMLDSGSYSMSSIVCMNDKTECFYSENYVFDKTSNVGDNISNNDKQLSILLNYSNYISSLSGFSPEKLTMWRLYGDDGKGIAIEFDVKNSEIGECFFLAPVSYQKENGSHLELDFIKYLIREIRFYGHQLKLNRWLIWKHFFKPYDYAVEDEMRLLYLPEDNPSNPKWVYANGVYSPISRFSIIKNKMDKEEIPFPLKISKIVLGPRFPDSDINEILIKERFKQLGCSIDVTFSGINHYRVNK